MIDWNAPPKKVRCVLAQFPGKTTIMRDSNIWTLVIFAVSLLTAILWSPELAPHLGLPLWIVFIAVWLDIALVLNIPRLLRHYALNWQLLRKGPTQANVLRVARSEVIVLFIIFVALPLALLLWALARWLS
jgi:hypothetical protein